MGWSGPADAGMLFRGDPLSGLRGTVVHANRSAPASPPQSAQKGPERHRPGPSPWFLFCRVGSLSPVTSLQRSFLIIWPLPAKIELPYNNWWGEINEPYCVYQRLCVPAGRLLQLGSRCVLRDAASGRSLCQFCTQISKSKQLREWQPGLHGYSEHGLAGAHPAQSVFRSVPPGSGTWQSPCAGPRPAAGPGR